MQLAFLLWRTFVDLLQTGLLITVYFDRRDVGLLLALNGLYVEVVLLVSKTLALLLFSIHINNAFWQVRQDSSGVEVQEKNGKVMLIKIIF